MRVVHKWRTALRWLFRRGVVEEELDSELQTYIRLFVEDKVRDGVSPEEARRLAMLELGGVEQTRERVRAVRPGVTVDALLQDTRLALRTLTRKPGVAIVAIATLAVGIGVSTVIFSLVNFFLIKPLPVFEPDRLVALERNGDPSISYPNFLDIREQSAAFSDIAAMRFLPMYPSRGNEGRRALGYLVTGNYFEMLGLEPYLGRLLGPPDDVDAGAQPVAVISYPFWQGYFGADANVIGEDIQISGRPFEIVGIAPPGFGGTEVLLDAEIWIPFSMILELEGIDWRSQRATRNAWVVGRLQSGVEPPEAEASLAVVAAQLAQTYPDMNEGLQLRLSPPGLFASTIRGPAAGIGTALLVLGVLTLMVVCANLSGLSLAAGWDRQSELSVRSALGAGRVQLVRMMMVESLLVAVAGAALGIVLTAWFQQAILQLVPDVGITLNTDIAIDWRVTGFAVFSAGFSLILFGAIPTLRSTSHLASALRSGPVIGFRGRLELRDVYVAAQVAICVVLIGTASMAIATVDRVVESNVGFDPDGAVTTWFDLSLHGYDQTRGRNFQNRLLDRLRSLPSIDFAALADSVPFSVNYSNSRIYIEGEPIPSVSEAISAATYRASPGFFDALGVRILEGRDFDPRDGPDSPPVAIVNEAFVDRLFPNSEQDVVGRRFGRGTRGRPMEIVGVVEGGRYRTLTEAPRPAFWEPLAQRYTAENLLVVRSNLGTDGALTAVENVVRELDPNLPTYDRRPLRQYLDLPAAPLLLIRATTTGMAGVGLLLSALGLYGLLTYRVARRFREFGLRVALGAGPVHIVWTGLKRPSFVVGVGALIGLFLFAVIGWMLAGVLYGTQASSDYMVAVAALLVASIVVCLPPIRRVLQLDPAAALRSE